MADNFLIIMNLESSLFKCDYYEVALLEFAIKPFCWNQVNTVPTLDSS